MFEEFDREQPYDDEEEAENWHGDTPTKCFDCKKESPLGYFVPEDWSCLEANGEQVFVCPQCIVNMNGYRLRWLAEQSK